MTDIDELILLVNNYCNLRCDYCSFREDRAHRFRACSPEHLRKVTAFFFEHLRGRRQAQAILCFNADGEALLSRELLLDGLAFASRMRQELPRPDAVLIALVTNATLVDAPFASALASLGVVVTVSLDGDAAAHDAHRRDRAGAPTHARVVAGIRHLQAAGVRVSLRAVISPETVSQLAATYRALQALHPVRPVKLRPLRLDTPPYLPADWVGTFTSAYLACVETLLSQSVPLAALPDDAYAFARFVVEGVGREAYCGAGRRMLWMTTSGHFTTCGLLSGGEEMLGHIDELATAEDFCALLDRPPAEAFRAAGPSGHAPCVTCRWLPVCGGGCPALPLLSGAMATPPLCAFYTALGEALERLLPDTDLSAVPFRTLRSFDV